MNGILYGIGTGPGDPELMTLKAVRLIRQADQIIVPGEYPETSTAYRIAVLAVPELAEKPVLAVPMPMTGDPGVLHQVRTEAAHLIRGFLDSGKNVAYLTLGDPAIYSTFGYLQQILQAEGYQTETVSGVPSFCAAAASLHISLVEGSEPLHIFPAVSSVFAGSSGSSGSADSVCSAGSEVSGISSFPLSRNEAAEGGTWVFMKAGRKTEQIRDCLKKAGREGMAVTDCGMESEKISHTLEEFPEEAGYFTIVISRQK